MQTQGERKHPCCELWGHLLRPPTQRKPLDRTMPPHRSRMAASALSRFCKHGLGMRSGWVRVARGLDVSEALALSVCDVRKELR